MRMSGGRSGGGGGRGPSTSASSSASPSVSDSQPAHHHRSPVTGSGASPLRHTTKARSRDVGGSASAHTSSSKSSFSADSNADLPLPTPSILHLEPDPPTPSLHHSTHALFGMVPRLTLPKREEIKENDEGGQIQGRRNHCHSPPVFTPTFLPIGPVHSKHDERRQLRSWEELHWHGTLARMEKNVARLNVGMDGGMSGMNVSAQSQAVAAALAKQERKWEKLWMQIAETTASGSGKELPRGSIASAASVSPSSMPITAAASIPENARVGFLSYVQSHPQQIRRRISRGIPGRFRGFVWQQLSGSCDWAWRAMMMKKQFVLQSKTSTAEVNNQVDDSALRDSRSPTMNPLQRAMSGTSVDVSMDTSSPDVAIRAADSSSIPASPPILSPSSSFDSTRSPLPASSSFNHGLNVSSPPRSSSPSSSYSTSPSDAPILSSSPSSSSNSAHILNHLSDLSPHGAFHRILRECSSCMPHALEEQIMKDLNRTFPTQMLFRDKGGMGQNSLFHVLKAYALFDPQLGYTQGMGYICACLLHYLSEESTFWMLVCLLHHPRFGTLRNLFVDSMPKLNALFYLLEKCIMKELPKLSRHLESNHIHVSMFASTWFLTLFAGAFGGSRMEVTARVWDAFMYQGGWWILKVALAMLKLAEKSLLGSSFEQCLFHLKSFQQSISADSLIESSLLLRLDGMELERWEREMEKEQKRMAEEAAAAMALAAAADTTMNTAAIAQPASVSVSPTSMSRSTSTADNSTDDAAASSSPDPNAPEAVGETPDESESDADRDSMHSNSHASTALPASTQIPSAVTTRAAATDFIAAADIVDDDHDADDDGELGYDATQANVIDTTTHSANDDINP